MTAPESEGSTYEKYWPSDGISVSEDITSNEREPKLPAIQMSKRGGVWVRETTRQQDYDEEKTGDSKSMRMTLMEEVLLLGLKDREVR